jgi:hypothetical protein
MLQFAQLTLDIIEMTEKQQQMWTEPQNTPKK